MARGKVYFAEIIDQEVGIVVLNVRFVLKISKEAESYARIWTQVSAKKSKRGMVSPVHS